MPRSIHRCPNFREPVSPFAAGCAICGADLEAARADLAACRQRTPSLQLPSAPPMLRTNGNIDWLQVAIAIAVALFLSPIGLILTLYWAKQHHDSGRPVMMYTMLAAAALALAALLAPVWFWSHIYGGL